MEAASWGLGRRIGFRFGILVTALYIFPFPIGALPYTDWLAKLLGKPWDWAVIWFTEMVLGLPTPNTEPNGSGDTTAAWVQWLLILIVAALGTVVWSILDRRRTAYPRLAARAWVVLRYDIAYTMLTYGFAKILKSQFPDLVPARLGEKVGEMSPMGLLWTFMSYSTPYTVFAGLAEAVGGVLLLWRRTTTLGAILIIGVMTNVVMLNLCYDVPVKQYSAAILIMTVFIALPAARRVIGAVLGYPTAEAPPRIRMSPRAERARVIVKILVIAGIGWTVFQEFHDRPSRNTHVHELYGVWTVDSYMVDGVERPPLATDPERLQTIAANPHTLWLRPLIGPQEGWDTTVDADKKSLALELYDKDFKKTGTKQTWSYARPAPDRLVIDGVHHGKRMHATLHREPDPLLLTRGFRWINEAPFNR